MTLNRISKTYAYRSGLSPTESRVLSDLAYRGRKIFTPGDLKPYQVDPVRFVYRLRRKGWVTGLKRNLYMIAPLEAGPAGAASHTVHSFVLAAHVVRPYYIGFWSALNYLGLTEETPSSVYVATTVSAKSRILLDVPLVIVTLRPWKMFGTTHTRIEDEEIVVSDPEKTIVDCLDHPEHAGGIRHIDRILRNELEHFDLERCLRYARRMRNTAILKRLGYLLELHGRYPDAERVRRFASGAGYSKLDPNLLAEGPFDERWRLRINEPRLRVGGWA